MQADLLHFIIFNERLCMKILHILFYALLVHNFMYASDDEDVSGGVQLWIIPTSPEGDKVLLRRNLYKCTAENSCYECISAIVGEGGIFDNAALSLLQNRNCPILRQAQYLQRFSLNKDQGQTLSPDGDSLIVYVATLPRSQFCRLQTPKNCKWYAVDQLPFWQDRSKGIADIVNRYNQQKHDRSKDVTAITTGGYF